MDQIIIPEYRSNLTLLEAKGQRWCKKAVKERRLYITKVDKGGCIIILNACDVDNLMRETLSDDSKFKLEEKRLRMSQAGNFASRRSIFV